MNSGETLKRWLAAINGHDASAIQALMAADHVFVDSLGNRVEGAGSMEAGWTIDGESWRTPAAWKVVIRDGRVVEWRVFADNKPVYEILGRRRP